MIENNPTTNLSQQRTNEDETISKKQTGNYDTEQSKKQDSRVMNFFNQEFIDRKIDFKPR